MGNVHRRRLSASALYGTSAVPRIREAIALRKQFRRNGVALRQCARAVADAMQVSVSAVRSYFRQYEANPKQFVNGNGNRNGKQ